MGYAEALPGALTTIRFYNRAGAQVVLNYVLAAQRYYTPTAPKPYPTGSNKMLVGQYQAAEEMPTSDFMVILAENTLGKLDLITRYAEAYSRVYLMDPVSAPLYYPMTKELIDGIDGRSYITIPPGAFACVRPINPLDWATTKLFAPPRSYWAPPS